MSRDLRRWLAACLCCQRRKPSRNKKYGLTSPMARASKPFATLHIDLVGPFDETTSGFAYILTAMCPFTQFPFAVPLPNKEADTVAKALNKEVFSLVGSPERLVSDRAPEFIGEVMQGVNKLLRIKHVRSSGYQPQGNQVERFHRFLVAALCIYCHEYRCAWDEALPQILFAFRASVSATTGYSPFFLVYGREAPLPVDSLFKLQHDENPITYAGYAARMQRAMQNVYKGVAKTQLKAMQRNKVDRDRREQRIAVSYEPGDSVLVWGPVSKGAPYPNKKKLLYQWSEPRIVKERVSPLHYKLYRRVELKNSVEYREGPPVHVNPTQVVSSLTASLHFDGALNVDVTCSRLSWCPTLASTLCSPRTPPSSLP